MDAGFQLDRSLVHLPFIAINLVQKIFMSLKLFIQAKPIYIRRQLTSVVWGHLYLVLTPINVGCRKVLVMWALHAAGAIHQPDSKSFYDWADVVQSASRALKRHSTIIQERTRDKFDLGAFIIASDLNADGAELLDCDFGGVPLLRVAADQRSWDDTLAGISAILEQSLEEFL